MILTKRRHTGLEAYQQNPRGVQMDSCRTTPSALLNGRSVRPSSSQTLAQTHSRTNRRATGMTNVLRCEQDAPKYLHVLSCKHVHVHTYMHACMLTYLLTFLLSYLHLHIYIYTHTYIHTYLHCVYAHLCACIQNTHAPNKHSIMR